MNSTLEAAKTNVIGTENVLRLLLLALIGLLF